MRRVCLGFGAAVLSCGLIGGCGSGDTATGSGAATETAAKDPNTGKEAMDRMKSEMGAQKPAASSNGPAGGQDAMERMKHMNKK